MVLRVYFAMNISSIGVVLLKQDQLLLLNDQITLRIIIFWKRDVAENSIMHVSLKL